MPRYADDSKDRVREAADIVELVGARTELKRVGGGRYKGLCPFHDERTPSFSVNATDGFYHCFGCGAGGDVFTFVQETEGLDFVGALESLAQRYGVELEVVGEDPEAAARRQRRERLLELIERASTFYERWLWDTREAAPARAYLAERGLTEDVLRTYRVGYAPSAWDTMLGAARRQRFSNREIFDAGLAVKNNKSGRMYDRFRRRIMFPLSDARGRVLGFGARALGADQQPKYLNSADGDIFHKGSIVYGAHLARRSAAKAGEVIACEGYTDVLALHQAGIENAVCVMGTAMTERQIGELAKLADRVLLALDADSAGQEAMIRAERVARGRRLSLRVVPLPEGRDPAEVAIEAGPDAIRDAIARSVPFVRFRVESELRRGDVTSAEGKDAIIAALRPVFAEVPPSALREELLELIAGRLQLQPALVSSWLTAPEAGGAGGPAATPPTHVGGPPQETVAGETRVQRRALLPPVVAVERELLSMAVAAPEQARPLLAELGRDDFSGDGVWRVAAHVLGHLEDPLGGVPDDDRALLRAVTGIVHDAAEIDPPPTAERIQRQVLELEIARLKQQIVEWTNSGKLGVGMQLKPRLTELESARDRLISGSG